MKAPARSSAGNSWGLFITVPISLLSIIYSLTSGLRSKERQVTAEIHQPVRYTPRLQEV